MNPASDIIARCGGVAVVADWLSVDRSWVLRWTYEKDRGGTGGLVPARHQRALLSRALAEGKDLSAELFFAEERPAAGEAA